jgi:hypothetical protein
MADLGVQPHVIEAVPTLLGAQLNVPAVHHVCTLSNRSRKRQRELLKYHTLPVQALAGRAIADSQLRHQRQFWPLTLMSVIRCSADLSQTYLYFGDVP